MKVCEGRIILIISLLVLQIHCDLPVHCMKKQIVGDWIAELTTAKSGEDIKCGHSVPDSQDTNYKAYENDFQIHNKFDLTLTIDDQDNNICKTKDKGTGQWTMIYDEGFQIELGKLILFAHSHYLPKENNGWKSDCDKTSVGWWHDKQTNEMGCFRAYKANPTKEESNEKENNQQKQTENLHIVQPKEYQHKKLDEQEEITNKEIANDQLEESPFILFNTGFEVKTDEKDSFKEKKDNYYDDDYLQKGTETNYNDLEESPKENLDLLSGADKYGVDWEDLDFSKEFTDHSKVVDRLNAPHIQKSWTATSHDQFDGMNIRDLNKFAGRSKGFVEFLDIQKKDKDYKSFSLQDVSDLPKEKSFIDMVGPVKEQGDCGSCYIFATMGMLQARLKLKYKEDVRLSVQHAIDCDYFNQGCDGGYPFLVEKFASEKELVREECHPYQGQNGVCSDSCDLSEEEKLYKVSDYRFIGGQYGHSNERNIMLELMNNGPLVVSFEPTYQFMHYQSGIYHSVDANNWIKNGEKRPDWEKVDHSVLLVGLPNPICYNFKDGANKMERNIGKYKILGAQLGVKKDLIRRGTDESNIESLAEAADPFIIKKNISSSLVQKKEEEQVQEQQEELPKEYNEKFVYDYGFLQMQGKAKEAKK